MVWWTLGKYERHVFVLIVWNARVWQLGTAKIGRIPLQKGITKDNVRGIGKKCNVSSPLMSMF